VPPFTRHRVHSGARVRVILAETESVSPELLNEERFKPGAATARDWACRIEEAFQRWESAPATAEIPSLDMFFLGERLPPRRLDDRIRRAVDVIRDAPSSRSSRTPTIAKEVSLSPSRLRHLFGEQVEVPIRRYRAWKRLRNSIQIASQEPNLLTLAMAAGYADASHMCNSMKLYFGEQPSFIRAHWRKATVVQTNMSERAPSAVSPGHLAPAA
jgi:AraC-like DNA-binding protein